MTALTIEMAEGTLDLFAGTWTCDEHGCTMRCGVQCAFCAVDEHGLEILESLALPTF